MKNHSDRFDDDAGSDEGFYSRKARRNDEDVEKFIRLMRGIGEVLGLNSFWKWMTR